MNFSQNLDSGWIAGIYMLGIPSLIYTVPLTILGEAVILWYLIGWPFGYALKLSFWMNLLSGCLSLNLIPILMYMPLWQNGYILGATYDLVTTEAYLAAISIFLAVCFVGTLVVEGVFLTNSKRDNISPQQSWMAVLSANCASYLGLYLLALVPVISWRASGWVS